MSGEAGAGGTGGAGGTATESASAGAEATGPQGAQAPPNGLASKNGKAPPPSIKEVMARQRQEGEPKESPPKKEPFRFRAKLKAFGEEEEVDLGEEELVRELQMARAARIKLKEVHQREAALKQLEQRLKESPLEALKAVGADPLALARQVLEREYKLEKATPEQREAMDALERSKALEEENASLKEQHQVEKRQTAQKALWAKLEPEFDSAIEKEGLTRSPATLRAIQHVGLEFLDAGIQLTPAQVVAEVARQLNGSVDRYLTKLPVDKLRARLGDARMKELLKLEAESLRKRTDSSGPPVPSEAKPREQRPRYLSESQFDKLLEERLKR